MSIEPNADISAKVVLLLVTIRDRAKVAAACVEKLGVSPSEVHVIISEAYAKIKAAAQWATDESVGEAILRQQLARLIELLQRGPVGRNEDLFGRILGVGATILSLGHGVRKDKARQHE